MARKIKIDNATLKRRACRSGRKEVGKKKQREYILIVCEGGKTESNYFEAIKNTFTKRVLDTYSIEVEGTGTSTLKIIEIANNLRTKAARIHNRTYDYVWTVFDRDSFPVVDFNNSIFKAQSMNINCAWSNEAFELWYVLHFQYRNTPMSREDYKKCIETEIRQSKENN
ncbi:MAG: RloB family protein [Bacteroidota bacterium]